jgi:isovaleryl-CoA dehydrogenase
MQNTFADWYNTPNARHAHLHVAARTSDAGRITSKDAAGVMLYSAERSTRMAPEIIRRLGDMSYVNDNPYHRSLRDAQLYAIGAGTSTSDRQLMGRKLFEETP